LSAYEAGWLASRIPRARVERTTLFSSAEELANLQTLTGILGEQYDLNETRILETGRMKVGGQTLVRVYLEFKDKQKYEALFLEKETDCRK